jgi:hypothetical protein
MFLETFHQQRCYLLNRFESVRTQIDNLHGAIFYLSLLPALDSLPIGDVTSDASTASTITFDFGGNISANVNFNPVVIGFFVRSLESACFRWALLS